MQTFTDAHDDDIVIYDVDADDKVIIEANEDDNLIVLRFDAETARALAAGILAAAGGEAEGAVLASTISFNEGVLRLATLHNKTVEFRYAKKYSKNIETRRFQPESCTGEGEHFRFMGYDPDRRAIRAYRLDRIKGTVAVLP